ncbi:MAG: ATP-dependent DNA helicase RecG [Phycisphaerae bacterium]
MRGDSPIQYVKGVGPRLAERFATLGIHTVGDLLEYYPFRHELAHGEVEIADLRPGITATVRGEVIHSGGRWPGATAEIHDGSDSCTLRWFNRQQLGRGLPVGSLVIATGKVQEYNHRLEVIQPSIQVFPPGAVLMSPSKGTQRVGVYRSNAQINSPTICRVVQSVLSQGRLPVEEILPLELCKTHDLPTREAAIRQMHSPASDKEFEQARRCLAYQEFFLMELAMALRRHKFVALQTGRKLHVTPEIDRRIRARFPFPLTGAQDKVIREIGRDLESGRPMTRLLQGYVGSGKTVVALYACLAAIANGRQAAIMVPTEILAQQHFANVEKYMEGSRVRRTLLRGKLSRNERAESLAAIEAGDVDLVVGTQALLERDVAFKDLAMVVVDEQHKFGVLQRANIRTKGPLPHYLVMTATPIPRTLAMTVFGDLDVSIIDAMPPGRGKVITKVVTRAQWETVMTYVRRRLEAGEQAYVVCPLIGEAEATKRRSDEVGSAARTEIRARSASKGPEGVGSAARVQIRARSASEGPGRGRLISAKQAYERLNKGPWRGLDVGLLHGSLKPADKQNTIDAFAAGKLHAVVATTVVEVGVDVANATIMIVENADRFGLSQLHQLRGRVGRGSKDSLCVLMAHGRGGKAAERLSVMAETNDGFKIAEADLRQRGPGELFGTRQHGLPELRVGDILNDFGLLEQARQDAFDIVAGDPKLEQPQHARMIPALKQMFGTRLALIDAG